MLLSATTASFRCRGVLHGHAKETVAKFLVQRHDPSARQQTLLKERHVKAEGFPAHFDRPARHVHGNVRVLRRELVEAIVIELDPQQAKVLIVARKDVPKRARNERLDARTLHGRHRLLTRRATAKAVSRDNNSLTLFYLLTKVGVRVQERDFPERFHVVFTQELAGKNRVRVNIVPKDLNPTFNGPGERL
ncbi:hypothetical protein PsorP6_007222 [Peronosclerospora sorghi]|uniref:Uncharacterized protein n=1 Tax=Peronosclerospora sorghi TaxID=230839 RepID=A0ACC0WCU9_9STRA|nr:hypothetical protein PsorP6_007222 [Peronosclerospora sorghi]